RRLRLVLDLYHEETEVGDALLRLPSALAGAATVHIAGLPGRGDPDADLLGAVWSMLAAAGFDGERAFEYHPLGEPRTSLARAGATARSSFARPTLEDVSRSEYSLR